MSGCCGNNQLEYVVPTSSNSCVNPIIYLLENALVESNGDVASLDTLIGDALSNGLYLQNKGNLCCPDCVSKGSFYFLGHESSFSRFFDAYVNSEVFQQSFNCCTNYIGYLRKSIIFKNKLEEAFVQDLPCCSNDFAKTVEEYTNTAIDEIYTEGLIEISTFGGQSLLPVLKLKILEIYPYATSEFIDEVLSAIANSGVIVKCVDCGIFIASADNAVFALENYTENE